MVLNPADLPTLNITPSLPHCQNVAMPSSMWHVKSLLEPQGTELGIKKGRLFRERKQVSRSILTWSGSPLLQKVTEHVQEKPWRSEEGSLSVGFFFFYEKYLFLRTHTVNHCKNPRRYSLSKVQCVSGSGQVFCFYHILSPQPALLATLWDRYTIISILQLEEQAQREEIINWTH